MVADLQLRLLFCSVLIPRDLEVAPRPRRPHFGFCAHDRIPLSIERFRWCLHSGSSPRTRTDQATTLWLLAHQLSSKFSRVALLQNSTPVMAPPYAATSSNVYRPSTAIVAWFVVSTLLVAWDTGYMLLR